MHPQFWPDDLDYAGKRVLVIGSGATAVTIVPEMAKTAAAVTMLQRSPTYMVARPSEDALANALRAKLPARLAYALTRLRNVALNMYFYRLAAQISGGGQAASDRDGARANSATRSTSPISRRATRHGISGSASCPTPTFSTPCATSARAS